MDNVFVTVGTTRFDELIENVVGESCLNALYGIGCRKLVIQHGRGPRPETLSFRDMVIDVFDFRPSIKECMESADLIISHAGSGSILESLWLKKKLVVIVNERLMNNHQVELAEKMQSLGHCFYGNSESLCEIMRTSDFSKLRVYEAEHHATRFPAFLDEVMGFS